MLDILAPSRCEGGKKERKAENRKRGLLQGHHFHTDCPYGSLSAEYYAWKRIRFVQAALSLASRLPFDLE